MDESAKLFVQACHERSTLPMANSKQAKDRREVPNFERENVRIRQA
jgi:hypothetical protein